MLTLPGNLTEKHLSKKVIITQYYETHIFHHGIKGMKKGVRRFQNIDGTLTPAGKVRYSKKKTDSSVVKSISKQMNNTLASSYKKPKISGKERAHVLSELMTHMTRDQRSQQIVSKYIGDYLYTFVKKSEGIYDIINKK